MKKTTLGNLIDGKEALQKLIKVQLPVKKAYALNKLVRELNAEYDTYAKLHQEIINKYGTPVEGKPGQFAINDKDNYVKEMTELHNIEKSFEIDFNLNDIPENAEFSVSELESLSWLLS